LYPGLGTAKENIKIYMKRIIISKNQIYCCKADVLRKEYIFLQIFEYNILMRYMHEKMSEPYMDIAV